MNNWSAQTQVGELVTTNPSRSRIFERLGIDYCCGGRKSLAEACVERDLDVNTVVQMLKAVEDDTPQDVSNWQHTPLPELIDHIVETHHAYLRQELPRLHQLLTKVAGRHGLEHSWLKEMQPTFDEMISALFDHMHSEEEHVFPAIRNLDNNPGASLSEVVDQMEEEHDAAGEALAVLRRLSNDYRPPERACNSFRALLHGLAELEADMHQHIHKENNILFPRALSSVSCQL